MSNIFSQERSFEQSMKERGFSLRLSTRVEGLDPEGKLFEEQTTLSYISHNGSSFWLTTPTREGDDLRLVIDLPAKLAQDRDLKLIIKGTVIFVEAATDQIPKQRVSVRFENKYLIKDED